MKTNSSSGCFRRLGAFCVLFLAVIAIWGGLWMGMDFGLTRGPVPAGQSVGGQPTAPNFASGALTTPW
jgi:hypothetical protein